MSATEPVSVILYDCMATDQRKTKWNWRSIYHNILSPVIEDAPMRRTSDNTTLTGYNYYTIQ